MSINKATLWTEKYRPTILSDACFPKRIHDTFKDGIQSNLMLQGIQGTGKTTLAKILCKGFSVLQLNGSIENSIDDIRGSVMQFCMISGFDNKKKIVWIDEADHLSQQAQAGLRGTIEKFHKVAFFIFTCNYPEKIMEPIRSRFEIVNYNFTDLDEIKEQENNYIRRIAYICKEEGLELKKSGALELIKRYYPDIRSMINTVQSISRTTKIIDDKSLAVTSSGDYDVELYNLLMTTSYPPDLYKYIKAKFANKESKAYESLSTIFLEWLMSDEINKSAKVGEVASCVHKYQYESVGAIDKLIPLLACAFEINRLIR